jgi:hypothetical protein
MDIIQDPIVEEVRKARQEHSDQFNHNIDNIVKDLKDRQKKYAARLVRRPPKLKLKATGS